MRKIRFLSLTMCIILVFLFTGCSKDNYNKTNIISKIDSNQEGRDIDNLATYEDVYELFIKYYDVVSKLEEKFNITDKMLSDSVDETKLNENLVLYISEYKKESIEFRNNLEKMQFNDEHLEDLRYSLIEYIDNTSIAYFAFEMFIRNPDIDSLDTLTAYVNVSQEYYEKALSIFEGELNINTQDYPWCF